MANKLFPLYLNNKNILLRYIIIWRNLLNNAPIKTTLTGRGNSRNINKQNDVLLFGQNSCQQILLSNFYLPNNYLAFRFFHLIKLSFGMILLYGFLLSQKKSANDFVWLGYGCGITKRNCLFRTIYWKSQRVKRARGLESVRATGIG